MTVTGKLCRNPFSTIKLAQEDGGSRAEEPDTISISLNFAASRAIFAVAAVDLLMHGRTLCIQKALEKSVIRVAGATTFGHDM
ncbi:hypothetical protein P9228_12490 [Mesorhizobium sp. WSM4898]|uniref:hypothetical protein n=1 Tax=Mesorhizobium sp. WSM4898 TaxID=3038544 RepID=UPI002415881E|nr:hypothetical protein [Mesorhizobium sp. WSM4898]MDG4907249.1 hypothetical protein [Mesorhizobium sp. WSM4898]WIE93703.1 hypothetical protein P9270_011550 [Mesorhizobium sp. WSM4875]